MRSKSFVWLFMVFASIIFSGCATVAENPAIGETSAPLPTGDKATLYIYRKHAEPTLFSVTIKIDDRKIVSLRQKTYTWVQLSAGVHRVKSVWPFFTGQESGLVELDVKPGMTYYLEVTGLSRAMPGTAIFNGEIVTMQSMMKSGIYEVSKERAEGGLAAKCKFCKPVVQE